MPVFKNPLNSLFDWISPRTTHEKRDIKQFKAPNFKSPAPFKTAAAKRQALISVRSKQAATSNLSFHRKTRSSGGIPWEDEPPSSPTVIGTVENAMEMTSLSDDDEMEDAGDEGAVDTMSEEDDSGLMEEEGVEEEVSDEDGSEIEAVEEERISDEDESEVQGSIIDEEANVDVDGSEANDEETASGSAEEESEEDEAEADEEDVFDANQGTNVIDLTEDHEAALEAATRQFEVDREAKFEEQKTEAATMLRDGWNMDTIDLYMLLDRRTLETLMPADWKTDFPLFPWTIWADEYRDAFLGGTRPGNDFIMIKAASNLLKLPVHVRNQIRIKAWYGRRAEAMVVKYCEDYMKFIHKDCKLWIPIKKKKMWSLICYAPGDEKTPTEKLEELILVRLRKRAGQVLELLRVEPRANERDPSDLFYHDGSAYLVEPPTLYGIVAKEAVIALVAYEPLSPRDALRTIAFFHMSKPKYDVWNALALAIVMMHCRNHLLKIKQAIPEDLDALKLSDYDEDLY
jgi:hypothetical protein